MAEQTIRFDDGAAYERMMGAWSRLVGIAFLDWLDVPRGARWVDVGCGNGAFTELLAQRTAPACIEALDPSEGQIAFALKREAASPARFRQGDAMDLPFDDGAFDAAVMALVLFFVPDPRKGLAELVRVVRPGGLVCAYMWDMPGGGLPLQPIYDGLTAMKVPAPSPPHPEVSTVPAMRQMWEEAGLTGIETRVISVRRDFDSFQDYWEACLSGHLGAAVRGMPPDAAADLRRRVEAGFPQAGTGPMAHTGVANAIRGRKPA
ncbi:MAG: methyltransferase domain-containing protein [Alsobacter sp.]